MTSETSEGPQLQGSSSDRSLREAGSWDRPVKGRTQNPDIVSGIGDQPDNVKVLFQDNAQSDAKSGDANFALIGEEEVFESCRPQENKTATMTKSGGPVLLSDPPYEENNPNRGDAQSKLENSGECTHPPEIPTSMSRDSFSEEHSTVGEDVKTSKKILSPNSLFGFIPCLNDYESEGDSKRELNEFTVDSSHQDNSPEELQELTVKFSETLQNLAQKLWAEYNLNVEIQNAKEISDIIQGCQSESIREDEISVLDSKISNERTVEGKAYETFYNDNLCLVSDKNNSIIAVRDRENNCKDESTDEIEQISSGKVEPDRYNYVLDDRNPSSEKNVKSKISQNSGLYDGQRNISSHQNDEDECRVTHFGSRSVVDESWRKRWYEVHPCLDRSFQQLDPRLMRTKRIFTGDRRNFSVHNIGEGDVPSGAYRSSQRYSFHGSGRNKGSTNNDNSLVVTKPVSEIKISLKENESKTTSDRDLMEAKSDSSLPCTWNKTNQLVDYLETKNYALKQLIETLDERNDDSKSRVDCEDNTLCEIIVIKDSDKSMKDDLAINKCTLSDNKKTACEHDNLATFRKDANEKTELSFMKIAGSGTNLTEEKILSDDNDQNPNKELTCTEDHVDAVEVREETTNSDANCYRKECFEKDLVRNEIYKTPLYRKSERLKDSETENKDLSIKYPRVEDHSKVEPGSNSACRDITLSRIVANNEGDFKSRQVGLTNSQYRSLPCAGVQAEYVEEIMDRQQQNLNEGLNFSSYSESESSNVESDFSEADEQRDE